MPTRRLIVRPGLPDDVPAATAIYADAVETTTATFELDPPNAAEMAERRDEVLVRGMPWLVAPADEHVVGYAYANWFRPRPAYRHCVEDSIYVAAGERAGGVGRVLLAELLARCEAAGARQMLAVIGDADNHASIALHRRLGFAHVGTLSAAGRKFDRWLDVVLMQRALGPGAATAP